MTRIHLASCGEPAPAAGQAASANPLVPGRPSPRGPVARRPDPRRCFHRMDPDFYRSDFPDRWARLVRRVFRSRDRCSRHMGVTFQTSCNWFDGMTRPTGDKVALMALAYPDDFAAIMCDAA